MGAEPYSVRHGRFLINEDGNLLLMDECGNYAYCPEDRFQVNFEFPAYSEEKSKNEMDN